MPDQNTVEYYTRRAEKSREMAETAISPAIARLHRQMAERYDELVRSTPTEPVPVLDRRAVESLRSVSKRNAG